MRVAIRDPLHKVQYLLELGIVTRHYGRLSLAGNESRQERNPLYAFLAEHDLGYHRFARIPGEEVHALGRQALGVRLKPPEVPDIPLGRIAERKMAASDHEVADAVKTDFA